MEIRRIEPCVPFYLEMGYKFKNGISEPDEEHLIRMEKNK